MDPLKTTVIIADRIITGFAPDGIFTNAFNADRVTPVKGVQGDNAYLENADESSTFVVTLMSTSSSIIHLDNLCMRRQAFSLSARDVSPDAPLSISGQNCRITKMPDSSRGGSVPTLSYNIHIPKTKVS